MLGRHTARAPWVWQGIENLRDFQGARGTPGGRANGVWRPKNFAVLLRVVPGSAMTDLSVHQQSCLHHQAVQPGVGE